MWCCHEGSEEFKAHDRGWEPRACHCRWMQDGQELPICSCTILNVLPLHIYSSINLSCALCHKHFHTRSFAHKMFPSISHIAFSQISSLVVLAGSCHFTMATPPGQLADIYIYWNGTCDETHQCLKQSYSSCSFHRLLSCPQWDWGMLASLLLALPWLPCGLLYRSRQITGYCNELGQRWWFEHWFKCSHSGNNMNLICSSQSSSLSFCSPSVIFCFCW